MNILMVLTSHDQLGDTGTRGRVTGGGWHRAGGCGCGCGCGLPFGGVCRLGGHRCFHQNV